VTVDPPSLLRENQRLRDELAHARAESDARIRELTAQIASLTELVAKSNERIAELVAVVGRLKPPPKARDKARSDEPPPASTDPTVVAAFEQRPKPPPESPLHDRPRPKQRPKGRGALPKNLPVDETTVFPAACGCGCTEFDWVDEVVEEKLDVRAHKRIRRTRRKVGGCKSCGTRNTAEAPPSPFERSKLTPESLAYLVVQHYGMLVPLDRLSRHFGVQGVAMAKSFLSTQMDAAAELLDPIDGEHWREILASDHLGTDGTGVKVQVPGAGLHHGFLEVYHSGHWVVFQYTPEKGGETQADKLSLFEGTLLIDAESRYNETFRRNPLIIEANCNAHPRRKLRDAEAVQPVLAAEGGRFVGAMFDLEEDARLLGLEGDALLRWRQERTRPVVERFLAWMDAVEPTLLYADPVAKVIRYYRKHWDPLMRFLDDPALPLDNSASEREFQCVAKYRLNSLFMGGTEGAHRAAVLLGILATCRRLRVDPEAYMTWVFVRRGTHRHKYRMRAEELTPAAFKAQLSNAKV
jgi:transposase